MAMTCRIALLDDATANRIAAGEVVERPASAVKELVENAIDAGAKQIVVRLEEGGKRRIEVADDGCGMSSEEAVLSLQRHATSKIRSSDDLFAIRTLGFRGEALPSVASVSHFTVTSKCAELEAGVRVTVHGGEIESVDEIGARDGTVVVVEELFYNTPARLKFLKSTASEITRVLDVVGQLAVAHPGVAFTVMESGVKRMATPGTGDSLGALAAVWGRDIARRLKPVEADSGGGIVVSGFLCPPDLTRPGRSHEIFFVNRRPIKSRLLSHALEDAVRAMTPDSRYPIAAIFVDLAPDMVDVNVHPTKSEVKFTHDGAAHHAVSQAVKNTLLAHGILPTIEPVSAGAADIVRDAAAAYTALDLGQFRMLTGPSGGSASHDIPTVPTGVAAAYDLLARTAADLFGSGNGRPDSAEESDPLNGASARNSGDPAVAPAEDEEPDRSGGFAHYAEQLRGFRVMGQIANTYIIAATADGLAIVDQHVAHERVLYERLTENRLEHGLAAQRLVVPFTLSLGPAEATLIDHRKEDFASAGWELEPFGRDAFLVRSVPCWANRRSHESLLRDIVDELVHQSVSRRLLVQRDHVTITNACKMAVKAGDPLTHAEMEALLMQLAETRNPYVCPHGRPIVITVPLHDIDRKFKRA